MRIAKKGGAQMNIEGYEFSEGLYYDKNHFWARVEGDLVVMGMNDYAQKMAGSIVYVGLPPEGKNSPRGKTSPRSNRVSGLERSFPW
jgi:hypothetical protein